MISLAKLTKRPTTFLKITGLKVEEFFRIVEMLKPRWKERNSKKIKSGRPYALHSLELQLASLLIYYRTYSTYHFLGFFFHVDESTFCRTIKRLEPLLKDLVCIKKVRKLQSGQKVSSEELQSILLDCTEQPIQRPTYNQKAYYSGKKKRHTIKTEIQMSDKGKILKINTAESGSSHDYDIFKRNNDAIPDVPILADSGYQGLQELTKKAKIPIKKRKNKPLDSEQKAHNTKLAKERVYVENKIREVKIFRIVKEIYRNPLATYATKMNIIAGLVNFKNGF